MAGNFISRGFRGRRREDPTVAGRVPPGQYLTPDFPVLSAGPTPHTPLAQWDFAITGAASSSRFSSSTLFRSPVAESTTVGTHDPTYSIQLDHLGEAVAT